MTTGQVDCCEQIDPFPSLCPVYKLACHFAFLPTIIGVCTLGISSLMIESRIRLSAHFYHRENYSYEWALLWNMYVSLQLLSLCCDFAMLFIPVWVVAVILLDHSLGHALTVPAKDDSLLRSLYKISMQCRGSTYSLWDQLLSRADRLRWYRNEFGVRGWGSNWMTAMALRVARATTH